MPATSSSAALGFSGLVQKMTTCENIKIFSFYDSSWRRRVRHAATSSRVRPVAEGLVVGPAASAQGYPIPNFIGLSVGRNHRDASTHINRAADFLLGVLDQPERRFKFRFDGLAGCSIPGYQSPSGTMARLVLHQSAGFGVVRLRPKFQILPFGSQNRANAHRFS